MTNIVKQPEQDAFAYPALIPTQEERSVVRLAAKPFIPAIKLLQGLSSEIKDEKNKLGDFYISADQQNLGNKVEIVVLHRRAHALLMKNDTKVDESYNTKSPIFRRITLTKTNRKEGIVSLVADGDWLIYLPAFGKFVTYFCGQANNQPLTDEFITHMTPVTERKTEYEKSKPYTNHFMLHSIFETEMWGKKYKSWRPKVQALEPFNLEQIDSDLLKQSQFLFFLPVRSESEYEELEQEVVSR